jgi:hypothetical protein
VDLTNPWALASSLLIGCIGMGLFVYGKKNEAIKPLGTGLALMVFPYFVHSVVLMWAVAAAFVGGLYALTRTSKA